MDHFQNVLTNYLKSVDAQMPINKKSKSIVPWPNQLPLFN